jgi:hypothetical protein
MDALKTSFGWLLRAVLLFVLIVVSFWLSGLLIGGSVPDIATSQPGLVSPLNGALIVALADLLIICALIRFSRWSGWRLTLALAAAYYGAVTVLPNLETWYFLPVIPVSGAPDLVPRLFLAGVPTAFFFIPLAVVILGKSRPTTAEERAGHEAPSIPFARWVWMLLILAFAFFALYWGISYAIAWQNPELRAFYGQPGEPLPFFQHLINTHRLHPGVFPLEVLRAWLCVLCSLPFIRSSRLSLAATSIVVGLFLSVPQNLGLISANSLVPDASVRASHMLETGLVSFLFGVTIVWILYWGQRKAVTEIAMTPRLASERHE